jgi:hypothetical protein
MILSGIHAFVIPAQAGLISIQSNLSHPRATHFSVNSYRKVNKRKPPAQLALWVPDPQHFAYAPV